ncbi:MAG: TetR/AcrR family transcriptional regulator [Planctomycetes bacterium]|jgi:AcrR family transcriptional regulator|nr:TetR/AcrR family transcriptional regulator [Planctomycetota bacterium]
MTPSDRRARERTETQHAILDAARELFAREGYEAVTMRRVAEAIDYAPGALYNHFPDKESLIRTLCRQDFLALAERFGKQAAIPDPLDRLVAIGLEYIRFAVEHPNHYRLMFLQPPPVTRKATDYEEHGDPHRDGYAFLRHVCAAAIAAGQVRAELHDAELLAQTMWAGVHGAAALQLTMHGDDWVQWRALEARARAITEVLVRGIAAPGARP